MLTRAEILRADKKISEEIINSLFQFADTNRDGEITYREYEIVTGNLSPHFINLSHQITDVCFIFLYF